MLVQYVAIARRGNSFVPQFMLLRSRATLFFAVVFVLTFAMCIGRTSLHGGQCCGNTVDQINLLRSTLLLFAGPALNDSAVDFSFSLTFLLGEPVHRK